MKKGVIKILTIATTVALVIGLTGCGATTKSNTTAKSGPVNLSLWDIWNTAADGNTVPFKKALADFKTSNPNIIINSAGQASADYFTKLKIALAANQAPDLIYVQGLGVMKPFADAGKLQPLDSYIAKDGIKNKLIDGALDNFTFSGKTYAIPTSVAIDSLYCNKSIFVKYGLSLPTTWANFTKAISVLSSKGVTPLIVAGKDQWPAMDYYDILALRTAGIKASKDALNNKSSWVQPAFVQAGQLLQTLVKSNAFNKSMMALGWDEAQQEFVQGKAAMVYNGSWLASLIQAPGSPVKDKVVALTFPTISGTPGTSTEVYGGTSDAFSINATSKNKDAAFTAIEGITQDMAKESYIAGSGLPAWKLTGIDESQINPLMVEMEKVVNASTSMCLWWDTTLGGQGATTHMQLVMELLALKITPEQFAQQMQSKVNQAN